MTDLMTFRRGRMRLLQGSMKPTRPMLGDELARGDLQYRVRFFGGLYLFGTFFAATGALGMLLGFLWGVVVAACGLVATVGGAAGRRQAEEALHQIESRTRATGPRRFRDAA